VFVLVFAVDVSCVWWSLMGKFWESIRFIFCLR